MNESVTTESVLEQAKENAKIQILFQEMSKKLDENKNLVRWQLDVNVSNFEILQKIGGYQWDSKDKKVIRLVDPIINDKGLLRHAEILSKYCNKDNIQSTLSDEEIRVLMESLATDYMLEFYLEKEEYDLDMKDYSLLTGTFLDYILITLKRAKEGNTQEYTENIVRIWENLNTRKDENKPSGIKEM